MRGQRARGLSEGYPTSPWRARSAPSGGRRRQLGACVLLALLALSLSSCRRLGRRGEQAEIIASGEDLELVVGRAARKPRHFLIAEPEIGVRFFVDPVLMSPLDVSGYSLWTRDAVAQGAPSEWTRVAETPEGALRADFRLEDGSYPLRASIRLRDGSETLVPLASDAPQAWVYVDTEAPGITWHDPVGDRRVPVGVAADPDGRRAIAFSGRLDRLPRLRLRWTEEDLQPGPRASELSYSTDAGATWRPLGEALPREGEGEFLWELPPGVEGEVDVRVQSWDAIGHMTIATLPLRIAGQRGGPGGSTTAGISGERVAGGGVGGVDGRDDLGSADPGSRRTPGGAPRVRGSTPEGLHSGIAKNGESHTAESSARRVAGSEPRVGVEDRGPGEARPPLTEDLELDPLGPCVRGGDTVVASWRLREGSDLSQRSLLKLEWALASPKEGSPTEGTSRPRVRWSQAGPVLVGEKKLSFALPQEPGRYVWRAAILGRDEARVFEGAPFRVLDPRRGLTVSAPEVVGSQAVFALASSAEDRCGLESLRLWLRRRGQVEWTALAPEKLRLQPVSESAPRLELDLRVHTEGHYEAWLSPGEGAPPADLEGSFQFELDRSPPRLAARAPVLDWVGGFEGEVVVDFDVDDIVAPILVDGRPEGSREDVFTEVARITDVVLPGGKITFPVPSGVTSYELVVRVRDRAGNESQTRFGPRTVQPPISLEGFVEGLELVGGAEQPLGWKLHRLALEYRDDLQVALEHQPRAGGGWEALSDGLPADAAFRWTLPAGDEEEHRVRASLFRRGELVARDISPPFRVVALADAPASPKVAISAESRAAYERGQAAFGRWLEGRGTQEELDTLESEAETHFRKAGELDRGNYLASYELSRLLRQRLERRLVELPSSAQGAEPEEIRRLRDETIVQLERTIQAAPNHSVALLDLGADLIGKGQYKRAATLLERSIEGRDSAKSRYNLGLARLYLQDGAASRAEFDRALALAGEDIDQAFAADIYYYQVYTWIIDNDLKKGRALYLKHRDALPDDLQAELEAQLRR